MDPPLTRPLRSSPDWCQCPGGDGVQRPRAAARPPPMAHPLPEFLFTGGQLPVNVLRTLMLSESASKQTQNGFYSSGLARRLGHIPRAHVYSILQ